MVYKSMIFVVQKHISFQEKKDVTKVYLWDVFQKDQSSQFVFKFSRDLPYLSHDQNPTKLVFNTFGLIYVNDDVINFGQIV